MTLPNGFRLLMLTLVVASSAFGANVLLYDVIDDSLTSGTTNLVSLSGSGPNANALVGSNIAIGSTQRVSPAPSLLHNCLGCVLNFTSGTGVSYNTSAFTYTFASGGAVSIVGGVDLNNNGVLDAGDIPAGTLLMSGSFLNNPTVFARGGTGGDLHITAGVILNSQNTQLNNFYFGAPMPGPVWNGILSLNFLPFGPRPPGSPSAILPYFNSSIIRQGSVLNNFVPEPSSVLLYSGAFLFLMGLTVLRRRATRGTH
jgi:hypothetical protein